MEKKAYHYYRNWYNSIIRALLRIYEFNGDEYSALAKKIFPNITPKQAQEAVELLTDLKLIAPDERGFSGRTKNPYRAEATTVTK
jgi:uncharacterized protein (TIGR02147 family)